MTREARVHPWRLCDLGPSAISALGFLGVLRPLRDRWM